MFPFNFPPQMLQQMGLAAAPGTPMASDLLAKSGPLPELTPPTPPPLGGPNGGVTMTPFGPIMRGPDGNWMSGRGRTGGVAPPSGGLPSAPASAAPVMTPFGPMAGGGRARLYDPNYPFQF